MFLKFSFFEGTLRPSDKTNSEYRKNVYSRVFVMVQSVCFLGFFFFCSSIATLVPPRHPCSTRLTFLIFWAIYQELPFWSILKKFTQLKNRSRVLLEKLLAYSIEIIFWGIFGNSYYMEFLQIIYKFYSSHLMIFLNMAYIKS